MLYKTPKCLTRGTDWSMEQIVTSWTSIKHTLTKTAVRFSALKGAVIETGKYRIYKWRIVLRKCS